MQDLILLRHAQAESAGQGVDDFQRPLSEHGMAEAQAAGAWLAEHDFKPESALCSPAQRARMTAAQALRAWPDCPVQFLHDIYEASPGELLALLDSNSRSEQLMLVGHNPGVEQLLALLTQGRSDDFRGLPPAALAWIRLEGKLEPGAGTLHAYWSP